MTIEQKVNSYRNELEAEKEAQKYEASQLGSEEDIENSKSC